MLKGFINQEKRLGWLKMQHSGKMCEMVGVKSTVLGCTADKTL